MAPSHVCDSCQTIDQVFTLSKQLILSKSKHAIQIIRNVFFLNDNCHVGQQVTGKEL
jgi:hypothetical protein